MDKLKDLLLGYKKVKLFYYIKTLCIQLLPSFYNKWYKNHLIKHFDNSNEIGDLEERINYYNKLSHNAPINSDARKISTLSTKDGASVYHFDSIEYLRFFDQDLYINTLYHDIIHVPEVPSILKSRPISNENKNSIVLKLNRIRHFLFINDRTNFSDKKNKMVGIGMVNDVKKIRVNFLEKHFNNPLCDVGHTNDFRNNTWKINFIPIYQQLQYKFILCWEGNDVATNLKYVMSSNSLAVTTKPKYETWFMEGKLIGGVHYVEIKDDFSDLDEKIKYYSENIEEAEKIIKNANEYIKQFQNKKREDYISIKVLEKYFQKTNQLPE